MTIHIESKAGLVRALKHLIDDIESGLVVSCGLHYEPSHLARLNILYVVGGADESELPRLPGVSVELDNDTDTDTETRNFRE